MPLFSWLQLAESLEITSNGVSSPQFSWFCFWLWLWSAGRPRDQFKLFCDGRPQITSTLIAPLYPQSWRNIFNNHINIDNTTLQCQFLNHSVFLSFDQSKVKIYPRNAKQYITNSRDFNEQNSYVHVYIFCISSLFYKLSLTKGASFMFSTAYHL